MFSTRLEWTANGATIVVALLLAMVLIKDRLLPTRFLPNPVSAAATASPSVLTAGTDLNKRIPGVNWKQNGRTLILALSTHCHFCTESAPFFRQISARAGSNLNLVGIFPQPEVESDKYLHDEGIHVSSIKQVRLDQLGVEGTPTLLLVDSHGIVVETWLGKLPPDKQQKALQSIFSAGSASAPNQTAALRQPIR